MANFQDILNKKASDIEPPKALPVGSYIGVVEGQFEQVTAQTGTPGFKFKYRLMQPMDDVDQAALAEAGGCQGKVVGHTHYVSDGNEFFFKQFLTEHLKIEEGDKSIGEMLAETQGKQLVVVLKHMASQRDPANPTIIHVVERTAAV